MLNELQHNDRIRPIDFRLKRTLADPEIDASVSITHRELLRGRPS